MGNTNKKSNKVIILVVIFVIFWALFLARKMFSTIEGAPDEGELIREQLTYDLIENNKIITLTESQFDLHKGDSRIFSLGIRNIKNKELYYKINIVPLLNINSQKMVNNNSWFVFNRKNFSLNVSKIDFRDIRFNIPSNVEAGLYFFRIEVLDNNLSHPTNIYAQADFTIKVENGKLQQ